jgi:hypothetical protein
MKDEDTTQTDKVQFGLQKLLCQYTMAASNNMPKKKLDM